MVERLGALFSRLDENFQIFASALLADEFAKRLRAQAGLRLVLWLVGHFDRAVTHCASSFRPSRISSAVSLPSPALRDAAAMAAKACTWA